MVLSGQRVLVVGLGASGLAVARLLLERGAEVIVNDLRSEAVLGERAEAARALGASLSLGSHDEALFTSVDRIVVSPGVPKLKALDAAEAKGIPIASEVEVASWFIEGKVVAITGTNGKSTVTELVGAMCERSGRPTFVGGNLGRPLVEVVGSEAALPGGVVVVELSSFQLERVERFHADVAALLNLSPDHLDRYADYASYVAAKGRIFEGQRQGDAAVVPEGDEACASLARRYAASLHTFGGQSGEVRLLDGALTDFGGGLRLAATDLKIRGGYNLLNASAAALIARLVGVESDDIEAVLRSFSGLPHRMEHVLDAGGVAYFDDSKATNVGAAVAALDGLGELEGRVVLIAGGVDKGGSYLELRRRMEERGRALVLIGEASELIEDAFEGAPISVQRASSMDEAVSRAQESSLAGDVVLLAPACSSFDMFQSYAERGEVFQAAVRRLAGADA